MATIPLSNGQVTFNNPQPSNPIVFEAAGVTYYAFERLTIASGFGDGSYTDPSGCLGVTEWRLRNIQLSSGDSPLSLDSSDPDTVAYDSNNPDQELRMVCKREVKIT